MPRQSLFDMSRLPVSMSLAFCELPAVISCTIELSAVWVIVKYVFDISNELLVFFCVFYLFKFIYAGLVYRPLGPPFFPVSYFVIPGSLAIETTPARSYQWSAMAFCMFWARSIFALFTFMILLTLLFMFCKLQMPIIISTTIKAIMTPRLPLNRVFMVSFSEVHCCVPPAVFSDLILYSFILM